MEFPTWVYNAAGEARVCETAVDFEALGPGWKDCPPGYNQGKIAEVEAKAKSDKK